MHFADLPRDILFELADILDDTGMNALCRTNSQIYYLLNGYLYRRDLTRSRCKSLLWAASNGVEATAQQALAASGYLDPIPESYNTALYIAAVEGHAGLVELLLKIEGINPNIVNSAGDHVLGLSVSLRHTSIVKLLLEHPDIDPNFPAGGGRSALMQAREPNMLKLLLEVEDIDVNQQDNFGRTALCYNLGRTAISQAALVSRFEMAKLLLNRDDTDPNLPDRYGQTALFWACDSNCLSLVDLLLKRDDIDPNARDNSGNTALVRPCLLNHVAIVRAILSYRNMDPNPIDNNGLSLLTRVMRDRHDRFEIESLLRAAGAS